MKKAGLARIGVIPKTNLIERVLIFLITGINVNKIYKPF